MHLSEDTLCRWVKRDQQVFVAEALAPLAVTVHHADALRNRDIVWFVDNIGACSVLIKGNSSQYDAGIVTAAVHLCWARLGIRSWIEWVEVHLVVVTLTRGAADRRYFTTDWRHRHERG